MLIIQHTFITRYYTAICIYISHIRMAVGKDSLSRVGGVELHDCWVATVRRCEWLWQHCQRSVNETPASSDAY